MEEAPENGKESPHSVYANGLIVYGVVWGGYLMCVMEAGGRYTG